MKGKLDSLPDEYPTIKDWEDHVSTIFTEVRLKKFIEVRGADAGSWSRTCALPAFWVGILYDKDCLDAAERLCKSWNFSDITKLSYDVSKKGFSAEIKGLSIMGLGRELIAISKEGLRVRRMLDNSGQDETGYLEVLEEIISSGKTPAELMLYDFKNKWDKDINKLIKNLSY